MATPKELHKRKNLEHSEIVEAMPKACANETAAVEFIEAQRWGNSPCCVHCGSVNVYKMTDAETGERNKRFLWRCRDCQRQYTARTGTVLEDSRIPVRHWCYALWATCASKKGVSALQIKRQTGVSYKSALFLMHRIRFGLAPSPETPAKLQGRVEVDETYIGPKSDMPGRAAPKKKIVVALIERDGRVHVPTVANVTGTTLKQAIRNHVERTATINTDGFASYKGIGKDFDGGHETVNHAAFEYARGETHVNTCGSFFALLKRGIHGTFRNVSEKHLHRYLAEFAFEFNTREMNDGQRIVAAIRAGEGKHLVYREPVTELPPPSFKWE